VVKQWQAGQPCEAMEGVRRGGLRQMSLQQNGRVVAEGRGGRQGQECQHGNRGSGVVGKGRNEVVWWAVVCVQAGWWSGCAAGENGGTVGRPGQARRAVGTLR